MPLQTTAQFPGINPNILGATQRGLANRQIIQQEENKQRLRGLAEQQLSTRQRALDVPAQAPVDETQEQAQRRMIAADPVAANKLLATVGIVDQRQKEEAASFANEALNTLPEQRKDLINKRILEVEARGGDASETRLFLDMPEAQLVPALKGLESAALTALQRQQAVTRGTTSAPRVQSSKILPGGLVQMVMSDQSVKVVPPDEANKLLIEAAERRGAELQGLRAGERGAAKAATDAAVAAFKGLSAARKNITNMNEGIRLLQGGAKSGAVESHLPSFKAASIKLDNLRNRLGLDVIGGTTFGALSESELNFALKTALPTGLDEEDLLQWMIEKRDTQMKVTANLEEAALFLGEPGNSVADFIKMKKAQRAVLPEGVTEEDIEETMRTNNMTRQQVLDRLGAQ